MIALGATLVSQFSWVRYIFGIFLVFTGIKMWVIADHVPDIGNYPILKLLKRHLRVTEGFRGNANALSLYTSPSPRDKRQSRMPSSA